MSGPKSVNWSVEENLAFRHRMLVERQQLAQSLALAARALCMQVYDARQRYGEHFPNLIDEEPCWPPSTTTLEETDALIALVRDFTERISFELAKAVAVYEMRDKLRDFAQGKESLQETSSAGSVDALHFHEKSKLSCAERNAKITSMLERAAPDGPKTSMDKIIEFARQAVAAIEERSRFETLLLELQRRIQRHNEAVDVARNEAKKASRLREKLAGLTGDSIKRLDHELEQVERQELRLRASLPSELKATVAKAKKLLDRQYAGMVIREELTRLGYQVEEGFETLFVSGGEVQLRKAELSEYHVTMDVNPSSGKLGAQVARFGDPDEQQSQQQLARDAHMQEIWCGDLADALSASERKGVRCRVFERVRAGVLPAAVVATISEESETHDNVPRSMERPFD